MFIPEVVVGGGVVLNCIILKCISNILLLMFVNAMGKTLHTHLSMQSSSTLLQTTTSVVNIQFNECLSDSVNQN